ncbi:hypothetical protein MRX96_046070 [Rhipicephalus microplus]
MAGSTSSVPTHYAARSATLERCASRIREDDSTLKLVSTDLDVKREPSSPESKLHDEHVDPNEEPAEAALGSDYNEATKYIMNDRLGILEDAAESSRKKPPRQCERVSQV